jgi:hypothetical protein
MYMYSAVAAHRVALECTRCCSVDAIGIFDCLEFNSVVAGGAARLHAVRVHNGLQLLNK